MADIEYSKLPLVTDLELGVRQEVTALLERLDKLTQDKARLLDQEDDTKNELSRLQRRSNKAGFRYGQLCFVSQTVAGRKTLDRELLLEAGCPALVIAQGYKVGAPGTRCTFKRLKEGE